MHSCDECGAAALMIQNRITLFDLYKTGDWEVIYPKMYWLLSLGWLALFAGGLVHYSGSWLIYTVFSLVFLILLISGFVRQDSYGYLFLVIMLWLGFWLKVSIHLIFPYPYVEPIGRFIGTPDRWDEVLVVASATGAGGLVAHLLLMITGSNKAVASATADIVPNWYLIARRRLWFLLGASMIFVAGINMVYSFYQTGIEPKVILVWPLNAAISLSLAAGFTMAIATLIWWDVLLEKRITMGGYPILLEGLISTVSGLSRGLIVFHVIPQMVALYQNKNRLIGYTSRKAVVMVVVFTIAIAVSFTLVNSMRNVYYSNNPLGEVTTTTNGTAPMVNSLNIVKWLPKFAIDRWVGVEGVMAVASFPAKGFSLFKRGLLESAATGQAGMLYEEICLSNYANMHTGKFRFGSLPGAGAFLYFTGSAWVVLLGSCIFTLFIIYSERGVSSMTRNPLLSAFVGGAMANIVVQFGAAPRQIIAYCIALALGTGFIWMLQTGRHARVKIKALLINRKWPLQ